LVVSHDLPIISRITKARPGKPYLALVLMIDVGMLRGLYEEIGPDLVEDTDPCSLAVHEADKKLIDSLGRYLALASDAVEARVMAPSILREIHFRLLMAPHGGMLRKLLRHDSHASNVARAIARIRRDFRQAIPIPELAREIGMSSSSFHKHFRNITATTPLQYQKELRLLEARRMLAAGEESVSGVAYDVGYESPTQFSREYARKFGVSPRADLARRGQATGDTELPAPPANSSIAPA
jgi:AraC-like DNA-binding protein